MTAPAEVSALLLRAARVVEERGLNRGWFVDHATGRVCTMGALFEARCGNPDGADPVPPLSVRTAVWAAMDRLEEFLSLPQELSLGQWNDTPGRTAGEVVAALRAAAGGVAAVDGE